ncbi:hypothetical protein R5R35_012818 [Gryllus longicercus]|uniref:Uncharacterized protein n=1 Tax=Gryllus longicercus TaxID=2509291 RepID=A0AAN9YXM2_9ORTH
MSVKVGPAVRGRLARFAPALPPLSEPLRPAPAPPPPPAAARPASAPPPPARARRPAPPRGRARRSARWRRGGAQGPAGRSRAKRAGGARLRRAGQVPAGGTRGRASRPRRSPVLSPFPSPPESFRPPGAPHAPPPPLFHVTTHPDRWAGAHVPPDAPRPLRHPQPAAPRTPAPLALAQPARAARAAPKLTLASSLPPPPPAPPAGVVARTCLRSCDA